MESSDDKQWASKYLLDPLTAPEPSDETGPGTTHAAHSQTVHRKKASTSSVRSSTAASDKRGSSTTEKFPDFDGAYKPSRFSSTTASSQIPTSTNGDASTTTEGTFASSGNRPRRASSLQQRHPGDQSHRPLDMLKAEEKLARRAPHLRKKNHIGADSIDHLDAITGSSYHHEGPYDAALMARNRSAKNAPLAALADTNAEALRATPRERVMDSIERHIPLDGVAAVPPGVVDRDGRYFNYQEGTDMMRDGNPEGGSYRRYQHVQYLPSDLKGKGEPSYSIEKALKTHKRNVSEGMPRSIEMAPQSPASHRPPLGHRSSSTGAVSAHKVPEGAEKYVDWERSTGVRRAESGAGGKLRKRMGSLRLGS